MSRHPLFLALIVFVFSFPLQCLAGRPELRVAVASNFIGAMEDLVPLFEKKSGIRVLVSYSSTGLLYAQIVNSAPYDLFLSADKERPELLQKEGVCEEPFVYARGIVVLFSTRTNQTADKEWQKVVQEMGPGRIAIASPDIAPYGAAARDALIKSGLWDGVKKNLVYGQNVGQAFQYGVQGVAESAFTALSLVFSEHGRNGRYWVVPEAESVVQKGCRLVQANNSSQAGQFMEFLISAEIQERIRSFGYE